MVEQTDETFEAVVAKVRPAADALLASLSALRSTPNEITRGSVLIVRIAGHRRG